MNAKKLLENKNRVLEYLAQKRGLFVPLADIRLETDINYPQLKPVREQLLNEGRIEEYASPLGGIELALRVDLRERIVACLEHDAGWVGYYSLQLATGMPETALLAFHLAVLIREGLVESAGDRFCLTSHARKLRVSFDMKTFLKDIGHDRLYAEVQALNKQFNIGA